MTMNHSQRGCRGLIVWSATSGQKGTGPIRVIHLKVFSCDSSLELLLVLNGISHYVKENQIK